MQRRTLRVLRGALLLGGAGQAAGGAAGALLAKQISGSDTPAGWPQAAITAGAAAAALIVSASARRGTRRQSLGAALATGAAGAAVAVMAARTNSMLLLLFGSGLFGAGNAAVMLARYAATDLSADRDRGRAIGTVLFATSAGAASGPNLLAPTASIAQACSLPAYTGPYFAAALAYISATAILLAFLRPDPLAVARTLSATSTPTTHPASWSRPVYRPAPPIAGVILALCLANGVMVGVMTMAPVELAAMGRGLGLVGAVISVHIAAMFGPSPLSGRLTDRLGAPRTIGIGGVALAAAAFAAASSDHNTPLLSGAVVLLGWGWNLVIIAASALLTTGVPPAQRPLLEAAGEVAMGIAATIAAATSGLLVAALGYTGLAAICGAAATPLVLAAHVISDRASTAASRSTRAPRWFHVRWRRSALEHRVSDVTARSRD